MFQTFTSSLQDDKDYRYERKFFISSLTLHEVESIVKLHPEMFSEIYYQRSVNNIYFDAPNLGNFFDNVDGNLHRLKLRIRWYGNLFGHIEKPVIELKIKQGLLGGKLSFPLHPFNLTTGFSFKTICDAIDASDIIESVKIALKSSYPTLLNCYKRKYYQSANGKYRITIDTDQYFYHISYHNNTFLKKVTDNENVILELKYDRNLDDASCHITNHFPFRITKSSKYVTGFEKLNKW